MTTARWLVTLVGLAFATGSGCGTLPGTAFPPLVAAQARPHGRPAATAKPRRREPAVDPAAAADAAPVAAVSRQRGPGADADGAGDAPGTRLGRSDWWVRTRRWLERVDADIRADLDFHENEGLEGFSPDAVEHVKLMRAEMNGDGGIGR